MDHGKNTKYFKSTDTLFYIGLPILILGGLLIVLELFWFYFLPYQMLIGAALAVVGGGLAFIPRSLRTSEKELDAIVSAMSDGYVKEVIENLHLERETLQKLPPMALGAYITEGEDILMRRGKDDRKCRTSIYSVAAVICTKNGIVISHKIFSLVSENASETLHEFLYTELDDVRVADSEKTLPDGTKLKETHVVFEKDGKSLLSLPTAHVIAVDRLAENLRGMLS